MYLCVCVCTRAPLPLFFQLLLSSELLFEKEKKKTFSRKNYIYNPLFIFIVVVVVVVTFVSPQSRSFSLIDAEKRALRLLFEGGGGHHHDCDQKQSSFGSKERETLSVLLCGFLSRHHRSKTAAQTKKNHTRIVLS